MKPDGSPFLYINAAGSAVVKNGYTVLRRVTINGPFTGTVSIYNNASGTSSALIASVANPTTGDTIEYQARAGNGLFHNSSGTPNATLIFD